MDAMGALWTPDSRRWTISPMPIADEQRFAHFGNPEYERAYMDYFSVERTIKDGLDHYTWVVRQILSTSRSDEVALVFGLFAQSGRSLLFLSEGLQVPHALLAVQGLTLAAVDWSAPIRDLILECCLDHQMACHPPARILAYVRIDARFSNVRHFGVDHQAVIDDPMMREALVVYVSQLDVSDVVHTIDLLSRQAIMLACATHKNGQPGFDRDLARLPALVLALRTLHAAFHEAGSDHAYLLMAIRGIWMLMVLAYITHMRPNIADIFASDSTTPLEWADIFGDIHEDSFDSRSKYRQWPLLQLVRGIAELSQYEPEDQQDWYRWMLSYLVKNFTTFGKQDGKHLDIRL